MRLDEKYVKQLFRRGLFRYREPEIKHSDIGQEVYIRERTDVLNVAKGGERILDAAA